MTARAACTAPACACVGATWLGRRPPVTYVSSAFTTCSCVAATLLSPHLAVSATTCSVRQPHLASSGWASRWSARGQRLAGRQAGGSATGATGRHPLGQASLGSLTSPPSCHLRQNAAVQHPSNAPLWPQPPPRHAPAPPRPHRPSPAASTCPPPSTHLRDNVGVVIHPAAGARLSLQVRVRNQLVHAAERRLRQAGVAQRQRPPQHAQQLQVGCKGEGGGGAHEARRGSTQVPSCVAATQRAHSATETQRSSPAAPLPWEHTPARSHRAGTARSACCLACQSLPHPAPLRKRSAGGAAPGGQNGGRRGGQSSAAAQPRPAVGCPHPAQPPASCRSVLYRAPPAQLLACLTQQLDGAVAHFALRLPPAARLLGDGAQ